MTARSFLTAASLVTCLAGLAACVPPTPPTSPGGSTVDQSVDLNGSVALSVDCNQTYAQTFTPSKTGNLDKVSLALEAKVGAPTLLIRIQDTIEGVPAVITLGSGRYTGPFNGTDSYTDVPLERPAALTAGEQYAIVISPVSCVPGVDQFNIAAHFGVDDVYGGGELLFLTDSQEAIWAGRGLGLDFAFRTWGPGPPGTNATTTTTTTTAPPPDEWEAFVGCYGGPGKPDLSYTGPKDSPNEPNGFLFTSTDGTCSGETLIGVDVKEFASQEDATAFCDANVEGSSVATPLSVWGFPAPDAYICELT